MLRVTILAGSRIELVSKRMSMAMVIQHVSEAVPFRYILDLLLEGAALKSARSSSMSGESSLMISSSSSSSYRFLARSSSSLADLTR